MMEVYSVGGEDVKTFESCGSSVVRVRFVQSKPSVGAKDHSYKKANEMVSATRNHPI